MIRPILVILAMLALAGCARRDDGMGDLWKGVACVRSGACR